MLMLSRNKDESFVIELGDTVVKIIVTRIGVGAVSGKPEVQFGIDAPKSCPVWRTEIYEAMQENKQAVLTSEQTPPEKLRHLLLKK